jgi:hypothetical protein
VEVIITLMMQQMHAYMLPGAARSLEKHLPKLLFFAEQDWIGIEHLSFTALAYSAVRSGKS